MKRFVTVHKEVGETPLAAIQKWKRQNSTYADLPASYAGRLDPMASGKLLILLGDECKRQDTYTGLDKEYEIEVLFSVGSDTGDVLGISEDTQQYTAISENALTETLRRETGAHLREYPHFSSKTVAGKPLFLHTLGGTLRDIPVPKHIEHIYRIQHQGSYTISGVELETRILKLLDQVPRTDEPSKRLGGNFRVDTIRAHWGSIFATTPTKDFAVLRLRVACASGTYMRSLAGRIGTALGTSALALSIKRTKIGTYFPVWRTGFWVRTY